MLHIHNFQYLREEYRPCKNPAFEQRIVIRQCVHCPKIDEYADDNFRSTKRETVLESVPILDADGEQIGTESIEVT